MFLVEMYFTRSLLVPHLQLNLSLSLSLFKLIEIFDEGQIKRLCLCSLQWNVWVFRHATSTHISEILNLRIRHI